MSLSAYAAAAEDTTEGWLRCALSCRVGKKLFELVEKILGTLKEDGDLCIDLRMYWGEDFVSGANASCVALVDEVLTS